ncbi:MAG: phosphoribosyl-AMP cyclohydrolase [Candidatus Nanopelagicales bacterium]|jgi:phosphoribosyl-AMP cyclohydrolase
MREEPDLLGSSTDEIVSRLRFGPDGLIPVIAQEAGTGRVLMLAWMDEAAVRASIDSRRGTYFSRSRGRQWIKGETSGHVQAVVGLQVDCDGDALLMTVEQTGPACHTGAHSCFDTGGGQ